MHTYKAILDDGRVQWLEGPPKWSDPVLVQVTILEEAGRESSVERGRIMAESLADLARRGTFDAISDPVAWQREIRSERTLAEREIE